MMSEIGEDLSPQMRERILLLEELSLNAWPCLQMQHYDGWLLRFAKGYTRRANSVQPLFGSSRNVAEKIAYCEQAYASQGQKPIFKLTPATHPADLDTYLEQRGYRSEAKTGVLLRDLADIALPTDGSVLMESQVTERWMAAYCALNAVAETHHTTLSRLLRNILPITCYASLEREGEIMAVGLAVLERGYVGLFDITTAAHARRQGLATQLITHLLGWGRQNGAYAAYLMVVQDNSAAANLYAKLGFTELYTYWYRVQQGEV